MFKNWQALQKAVWLIHFEQSLFGCWCSGPCRHTHGAAREWFWNTKHLMPFMLWFYYDVLGIERPEL